MEASDLDSVLIEIGEGWTGYRRLTCRRWWTPAEGRRRGRRQRLADHAAAARCQAHRVRTCGSVQVPGRIRCFPGRAEPEMDGGPSRWARNRLGPIGRGWTRQGSL